jgi:protocatechuate 3,4-dioxygenase beta subunit
MALSLAGLGCSSSNPKPAHTYSISGTVTGATEVTLSLSGASTATVTTDASGTYSFAGLPSGNYTVAPSKTGFTFAPVSRSVNVAGANVAGQDFTASAVVHTYAISGTVTGGSSVLVTLSGASAGTTTTDSSGKYNFSGLVNGSYTVTPSKEGYSFLPTNRLVTVGGADATEKDFAATLNTYAMSGTVSGASDVMVTLTGASSTFTVTDASGNYTFLSLVPGSYTVTPTKAGYTFSPDHSDVSLTGDVTGKNFDATLITYAISGTVSGASNVTVTLSGDRNDSVNSDSNGNYTFSGVPPGLYTVTPGKVDYTFTPGPADVHIVAANETVPNFTATLNTYTIAGTVTDASEVEVVLSQGGVNLSSKTTAVDTGNYSFPGLEPGTYALTPKLAGYSFSPDHLDVALTLNDFANQNFTATLITHTISGTVTDGASTLAGVTVSLTSAGGSPSTYTTTADGSYTFTVVPGTYTVAPKLDGKAFYPSSSTLTVTSNVTKDFHVGEWRWQHPLPQGNDLRGAWGAAGNDVWLVGSSGTILHWDGTEYRTAPSGTSDTLYGVGGTGATDVWAAGNNGTVVHGDGTNGGWTDRSPKNGGLTTVTGVLRGVWGSAQDDVWVVGASGTVAHWGGVIAGWQDRSPKNGALTSVTGTLTGVWGSGPDDVWVVGLSGTVVHWGGVVAGWEDRSPKNRGMSQITGSLFGAWGTGSTDVWVVGHSGNVVHWGGTGWEDRSPKNNGVPTATQFLYGVWGSGGHVWTVDYLGTILHRDDAGNWSATSSGPNMLMGVWGSSATDLWAVGLYGTLVRGNGTDWTSNWAVTLKGLWASGPSDAWAVGNAGTILHWDGTVWSKVQSGTNPPVLPKDLDLLAIWGSSATDVWAVGGGVIPGTPNNAPTAVILHWDGTGSWEDRSYTSGNALVARAYIRAVAGSSQNDVWAIGDSGFIMHYNGQGWTVLNSNLLLGSSCARLWSSAPNDAWCSGGTNVFHLKGEDTFERITVSANVGVIWGNGPSDVWFVGADGMLRWDGQNLSPEPSVPRPPNGASSAWRIGSGDVWARGSGDMFHWNGSVWDSVPFAHPYDVNLGGSATEVWAVSDGGKIWRWQ